MLSGLFRKIAPRSVYDVMAAIACFGVLAGGTAYAADTIRSGDIIDNEVTTTDIRDDTFGFGGLYAQDLAAGSVRSSEVLNDSLTNVDIQNFSLGNGDYITGSVDSRVATDNSLTGADIANGSLKGEDVGKASREFFQVDFDQTGSTGVGAFDCVLAYPSGLTHTFGDHLVLTPVANVNDRLIYTAGPRRPAEARRSQFRCVTPPTPPAPSRPSPAAPTFPGSACSWSTASSRGGILGGRCRRRTSRVSRRFWEMWMAGSPDLSILDPAVEYEDTSLPDHVGETTTATTVCCERRSGGSRPSNRSLSSWTGSLVRATGSYPCITFG